MIDRKSKLPVTRQCKLLALSRSTAYYQPKGASEENLAVMRAIDELYLERPTRGSRMMKDALEDRSVNVGRHRIRRLMRLMGLCAIYPKKRTSVPFKGHKIYPYLLRGLEVARPRQVYATDITYIPMAKGFLGDVPSPIWWLSSTGIAARCSHTASRTRWRLTSAWRLLRRRLPCMGHRRSSIPIKDPSSPLRPSRAFSRSTT